MTMILDPTFWTFIAFVLCCGVFGMKAIALAKKIALDHINSIEKNLKEAQELSQEAESFFYKREKDYRNLQNDLTHIHKNSELEIKHRKKEADQKLKELESRHTRQFVKRMQIMEEQSLLKLRKEILEAICEGSTQFFKNKKDEKSQHFFIKEGLENLPKDIYNIKKKTI